MALRARGFNFVEALVTVAILVTLAGVVVPMVTVHDVDEPTSATDPSADLADIATALGSFVNDTRTFPTGTGGAASYHYLFSDGIQPDHNPFASGPGAHVARFLVDVADRPDGWAGPYLRRSIGPDPWGRAYVVNVNGYFSSMERVVVLCAGPNGRIDTTPSSTIAGGDDQIVVLE